jgi:hypothetical protein
VPVAEAGRATLLVGTAVFVPLMDDDGLVGDDVFAQPTTNTVPTTTARPASEVRFDMEISFVNQDDARVSADERSGRAREE